MPEIDLYLSEYGNRFWIRYICLREIRVMLEKTAQLDLREDFVAAMRKVANSVTVVTTDGTYGKFGATVSSFCSVSADPPTVLVCLNLDGRTSHAIKKNGVFCVNVIPEPAVEIAKLFAGMIGDENIDRFADSDWQQETNKPPVLKGVTAFSCSVCEVVEATSHLIFIGEVKSVQISGKKPLLYLDRKFCKTNDLD